MRFDFKLGIYFFLLIFFTGELYSSPKELSSGNYDWQWFFYEQSQNSRGHTSVYRPFFMKIQSKDNVFRTSLMPFLFWGYENKRKEINKGLLGFYGSDRYVHDMGGVDFDVGLFPLIFYGEGQNRDDNYFFLYPIGGSLRGKMGQEYISPWIFPGIILFFLYPPASIFSFRTLLMGLGAMVPLYAAYGAKDYHARAILWPLIMWGKGAKRKDLRIWPFYSRNYKKERYDNYTWLMLFNYEHLFFRNDEKFTFFFFPVFGKKWSRSGESSATTLLYPFFSWGFDRKRGSREINMPWPLVQFGSSEKPFWRKRIFFPFYGKYESTNYSSTFITPLYFNIESETSRANISQTYSCFIFWMFKRDYKTPHEYYGNSWGYFKIWPLINFEWSDSGLFKVNFFSLLPFRDTSGYEKLYAPFWSLFEYQKRPDGTRHLGLLFRTFYQVWDDSYLKFKVPFLLSYEKRGAVLKHLTFLLGGFGYDSNPRGRYLKFLWIPIKLGEVQNHGHLARVDNVSKKEWEFPGEDSLGYIPDHRSLGNMVYYGKGIF